MLDGMHFRAASRDAGGRLRAHKDVRSETGRTNDSVKSARVKRLRAGNLFSDAYASDFIETQMLTGGRNLHRSNIKDSRCKTAWLSQKFPTPYPPETQSLHLTVLLLAPA